MKKGFYHIILLLFLLYSCKRENMGDCFKSTGEIITEVRMVAKFDKLYVEDNVNVFITIDSIREVRIEAGKNLIPLITTEVVNNQLTIKNNNRCNWVRSYKHKVNAYITVNDIKHIHNNGYGKIVSTDTIETDIIRISVENQGDVELILKADYTYCDMHSSGDIILKGWTGVNEISTYGSNWVRCSGLRTGYTYLWSHTTGDCYVNVTKELGAYIYSIGNVYYSGNPPSVITEINGSGQVISQ